jgi:hypothetical protein
VDWEVELGVVIGKGGRYALMQYIYYTFLRFLLGISQAVTANTHSRCDSCCTDKKEKIFLINKEIQMGSVAKPYI